MMPSLEELLTDRAKLIGEYQAKESEGGLYMKPDGSFWMEQEWLYLVRVPEVYQGVLRRLYEEGEK